MRWAMVAAMTACLLVGIGCDSDQVPEKKEPYQPSQPPPGFVEERMKNREKGAQPGRPEGSGSSQSN